MVEKVTRKDGARDVYICKRVGVVSPPPIECPDKIDDACFLRERR